MTQKVFHRLVGYDRASEEVVVEFEIPDGEALDYAKTRVAIQADDPDAVLCYRLDFHQARDIAGAIGAQIDAAANNFYMEGFSEPVAGRQPSASRAA